MDDNIEVTGNKDFEIKQEGSNEITTASSGIKWKRYRFCTKSVADWRPLVYDPRFPSWCTGYGGFDDPDREDDQPGFATIVMYLPEGEPLEKYYDDAFDITEQDRNEITFTSRFPKADAFIEIKELTHQK